MVEDAQLPEGVDENYVNVGVREALKALQATPDYEHLAAFLLSLREGFLVVDITGTSSKRKGPRVRTIRSTNGQLVLPIFTSMNELRSAGSVPKGGGPKSAETKGALMPAQAALSLISSDRFVAAEFDKASAAQVILRKYISLANSDDSITAESLEANR